MRLTAREKYSYGIGALGKDLAYAVVAYYLMIYFTDHIGLNPAFVGTLFLVARLWDAVNDPAMGMLVDNTRSKYGKFRPWILIGTVLNAVIIIFLFSKPNLEGTALYAYYSVMYILWGMTYTVMDIPYWSMLPSLSTNKEDREKISVIPRVFASTAWLLLGTFGLALINKLGNGDSVVGFSMLARVIAVIFVITTLITVFNVKEKQTVSTAKVEKVGLKKTFKIIGQNDQLVAFIGVVLAFNLAIQLSGGMSLYYFKYVSGNENLFPIFTSASGLAEIAGLLMFPMLVKRIGRNNVFKLSCGLPLVGLLMLLVIGYVSPQNALLIAISGIVFKIGGGLTIASTTVMLADVVDYSELKFGTRNESIIFSCQTLLVKSASAISGWLVGVGLVLIGYQANVEQTASTILGMRVLTIIIPIAVSIVSYVLYRKYYKLNNDKFENMQEDLVSIKETA